MGGVWNECDGCLIQHFTHSHLIPHASHIPHSSFLTLTHATGKVTIDNKERVQLTGCKASILSLQFDYQVSDTSAYVQTRAQTHTTLNTHTHPGTPHLTCVTSSQQEKQVLAASNDGTAHIWSLEDGTEKVQFPSSIQLHTTSTQHQPDPSSLKRAPHTLHHAPSSPHPSASH